VNGGLKNRSEGAFQKYKWTGNEWCGEPTNERSIPESYSRLTQSIGKGQSSISLVGLLVVKRPECNRRM